MRVGGIQIDQAVAEAFLEALAPAGLKASLKVAEQVEGDHEAVLAHFRRDVERARYEVQRAERRYRAVDPEHRLVARGLEAEWEQCLRSSEVAEQELARRERQRPPALTPAERSSIRALGQDVERVWSAPTTTDRDRKELLRTLLEEVLISVSREEKQATLTLRWRGGLVRQIEVPLPRSRPAPIRTEEETIQLVRRLAAHYPDAVSAGILNRQGRRTATGMRFTANRVSSLRNHRGIPCYQPPQQQPEGELLTVQQTAQRLGVAPSTVHRWLNDGFIAGEQVTPGAPWRIRFNEELRSRFVEEAPDGYVTTREATRILGISRQTVLHRVKSGDLEAVHVCCGRRKGLRIKMLDVELGLFDQTHSDRG
jgi:excisionase family DNA binding protein